MLLGEYNTGKTTLLRRMSAGAPLEGGVATVVRDVALPDAKGRLETVQIKVNLVDTLGTERRAYSLAPSIVRGAHIIFLTFRPDKPESAQGLNAWLQLAKSTETEGRRYYIIRNSFDGTSPSPAVQPFDGELSTFPVLEVNRETDVALLLDNCVKEAAVSGAF